jgi:phosphatidylethanolamine/phosphatidyl-N-methylethanolamine N-methyltransferase
MGSAQTFFGAFLRAPGAIGAVFPSSAALARKMIEACDIRPGHVVAELGAGTGPVTRALADLAGVSVVALEPDPVLAAACRLAAPSIPVEEAFAQDLSAVLARHGHAGCERVVSSLPFAGWPADLQDAVMDGILGALAPGGRMVTFTYMHSPWLPAGGRARALLERRFATVQTTSMVWGNLPPAFVYVCDKAG